MFENLRFINLMQSNISSRLRIMHNNKSQRIHAFEFNDHPRCPGFIRTSIIEILGASLRRGDIYAPAIPLFEDFCRRSQCSSILDLCSGSGEPASIFIEGLEAKKSPVPTFYLSDLSPDDMALNRIRMRHPAHIKIIAAPLDASDIPVTTEHQARVMITALHHFQPDMVRKILSDAVENRKAIFIAEPFTRSLRSLLPILKCSYIPGATLPFYTQNHRLLKALFTYLIPLIPLFGYWDSVISARRMYSQEDLIRMVAGFDTFDWQFHNLPIPCSGTVTVFTGIPKVTE